MDKTRFFESEAKVGWHKMKQETKSLVTCFQAALTKKLTNLPKRPVRKLTARKSLLT